MTKVHAEIEYLNVFNQKVHSDLCPPDCDYRKISAEHYKSLHDALDEWIYKSNGTGIFYIGSEKRTKSLQENNDK